MQRISILLCRCVSREATGRTRRSRLASGAQIPLLFLRLRCARSPSSAALRPGTDEPVSDEEMALINAALAAARARPFLSAVARRAAVPLSFATYSAAGPAGGVIKDSPLPLRPPLNRFRGRRALAVTDITATEWCQKQMEFVLEHGKPERTEAMKAGLDRHAQLEEEAFRRVNVAIRSAEESWALKFMNFIVGTNQLMLEDITREIPVFGCVEGLWMIGTIDEIRLPSISSQPILVDTKTRSRPKSPPEAQKRNGRLQLMCYKYLWDNLISRKFPAENFFSHFDLDPNCLLSKDVKRYINCSLGFKAKTFEDVVKYFKITCHTLQRLQSQEQLLLRYELQVDDSLLEEYQFTYDARWFKDQIQEVISFWHGSKEPKFVTEEERWKCRICKFAPNCPMIPSTTKCSH